MRALSGWEMHDGGATIDDEHPGTCQWILDHDSLRSWTSDPHPGIIFIFGPSGCGKSVLSKFLSRHFRDSEEGDVLTFFCRGVAGDCNASMVVEALLYQLLAIEPSLHTHVPVKYQDPDNLFSKDRSNDATKSTKLSYLWEIFTNILAHSKLKKLFAFIDGLDECEASSREKLLFLLRRTLSQRLARGFQETTNVKICITCRPFGNVHESMHHNIHLRHHSDGTKSNAKRMDDDIKQLVQSELSEIGHAYTPQLRQYAEDMILARAQGMFLWVSCILDRLRHAESTPETVENILHSFPSNMNGYYSGVLDQLSLTDANGMARRILSMILMAVTPLRHDQLAEALAIRPECTSTADLRKFKNMDIVNWVHSNCSQLIKSNGSTFELVHYSLAEYLNQNIDKIVATFGYDIPNAQLSMAQLCIRYMNFEDFRSRLQHFESEEAVFEAYPFYKYASTYWPIHLRLCGDVVTQGMETFSQFLDPDLNSSNYKTWCSVMQWYTPYRVPWDGLPLLHVFAHYGCINAARAMVLLQKPFRGDSFFVRMKKAGSFGMRVFAVALGTPCFGISVDVDELASFGKTALTCACETNEWEMVYLILEHGAHPDGTPSDLTTPLSAAARRGHTDVVNLLLLAGATIDLPSRNPMGNDPELTPLHWACVNGHVAVVQLLLASGAKRDSLTSARDTPLLLAIENNHIQIAEMLVHQGVDLSLSELSGTSPLISAARRGSLELVRLLLRKGARPNVQQHSDGITALHWAVSNEHEAIVVELLLYNADPMIRSKNGTSLLHLAAHRSHAAVVQSLLGAKADPNEIDGGGCGPIHYAAGLGHKDVVQTLLDGQANIGLTDTSGVTPLNWASMRGHRDVVMLLLHRGADVTIKAANGLTPLKSAAQSGYLEIVHLLIAAVKDLGALDIISSSLTNASMMGHIAVVQALIDSGADINYLGTGHYTALSGASSYGRVDIIKLLLSKSASLECGKGPLGCTPLGHAVQNGHAAAVLALLSAGAQKTTVFADGTTLLHMAAVRGCVEILDILLAPEVQEPLPIDQESGHHDIDKAVSPSVDGCSLPASLLQMIDRRNDTGETALTLACGKGHCVIAERLIAAGAHVGFRYPNHNTLLHHVTGLGHHDLIRLLISKTNHIDDSANNTHHPLHIACNNSGYEAAKILLDAGAQPSVDCGIAGSPLHQAALKGDTKMISLLLDHGAVVDQPQIDGSTPLHLATRLKHEEAILRLLSAGANPALRDPWTGSTLYHESAYNGNTKLIQACFDAGLPVDARDELDRTPLMKAIAGGHMAIMQNLIAGGSDFQLKDSFGLSAYDYAISRYVFDDQSMTVLWDEDIHAKSSPTKCFRFGLRLTQIASTAVRLSQSMQREHPPRYYFIADINRCVILLGKTELCNSGLLIYTTGQLTAPLMREMLCRSCRVLLNVRGVRYMCQRCPDMMFCATCFAKYQSIGGHGAYCRGHTFIKCKRSRGPLQQGQEPSDDEDWSDTAAINADWTEARMKDWLREVETFALESAAILGPIIQASLVRQSVQMLRYPVRRVLTRAHLVYPHWVKRLPVLAVCKYRCFFWRVMRNGPSIRTPGGGRVCTLAKRERRRTGMAVYTEWLRRLLGYGRYEIDEVD